MATNSKRGVEYKKITNLIPDPNNANLGTERGLRALDDSLISVGLGRSVVTDKNGVVIAGNKTVERAADRGFEDTIVVHTTGKQLVVVQRDDLDLAEGGKARELAYYDNRVAELDLTWKPEQLQADKEAGVEVVDKLWHPVELERITGGEDDNYSRKIEAPTYEPSGDKPQLNDLFDNTKTKKLIADIEAYEGLADDEKEFLIIAAQRHTVLDFGKIAEYYSHADEGLQSIMEDSALVIIDFDKAIELGFVQLTERIAELAGVEYDS